MSNTCPTEYGRANDTTSTLGTEYVLLTLPDGEVEVQIKVNNQYVLDFIYTNHDDVVIGESSGLVYVRNDASVKAEYEYTIDITTSDGVNDQVLTTSPLGLAADCGVASTTIGSPVLEPLYKIPNTEALTIGGTFTSSNPSCPIYYYYLSAGEDAYDIEYWLPHFTITMEADDNSVNAVTDYAYSVTAVAANYEEETVSGTMDIDEVCLSNLVVSFTTSYTYDLPEDTPETITVVSGGSAYITAPPDTDDALLYLIPDGVSCS